MEMKRRERKSTSTRSRNTRSNDNDTVDNGSRSLKQPQHNGTAPPPPPPPPSSSSSSSSTTTSTTRTPAREKPTQPSSSSSFIPEPASHDAAAGTKHLSRIFDSWSTLLNQLSRAEAHLRESLRHVHRHRQTIWAKRAMWLVPSVARPGGSVPSKTLFLLYVWYLDPRPSKTLFALCRCAEMVPRPWKVGTPF
eukprot:2964945-Rhodomonas_salina.1